MIPRHTFRAASAVFLLAVAGVSSLQAAKIEEPKLEPLLCRRGETIFSDNFEGPLKPEWSPTYKTRWTAANGLLTGQPATTEDQAKAHDEKHSGRSPEIQLSVPTTDYVVQYSFKLSGTITQQSLTFNDGNVLTGTGHISALQLHFRTGAALLKKKNSKTPGDADETLATNPWKPKPDQWYHVLQETRGEEVVVQIMGGPTLLATHPRFATAKTWLSLGTWGGGTVTYANVRLWKGEPNPQWEQSKRRLAKPKGQ